MLDPRAVLETCSLNSWALGQEAERHTAEIRAALRCPYFCSAESLVACRGRWWVVRFVLGSGSRRDIGNEQDEGMLAFTLESGRARGRPADIIKCLLDML